MINPGKRVRDVHFTEETLAVDLHLRGIRVF
jgi:hypothetical protein